MISTHEYCIRPSPNIIDTVISKYIQGSALFTQEMKTVKVAAKLVACPRHVLMNLKNILHLLSLKRLTLRRDGSFINHDNLYYLWTQKQ
jgi:hypothetical protein